ncbi:hypothetical protein DU20_0324 [Chlamydia muridarum]|nr:hypothetical protein DU17_0326 [Chlamydia muridarum]KDU83244.1 hypothetical protein DU20_0324 [Chlamydia muridarum]KDU84463.1 hypothetical protein DU21_0326 [Chlamydia muridarum]
MKIVALQAIPRRKGVSIMGMLHEKERARKNVHEQYSLKIGFLAF